MGAVTAPSVFQAGADDKNLTVDAYGVKNTSTQNSVLDVLNTFASDAAAAIKKNPGTIDRLKSTIDLNKSGKLSATDMITRASSLFGGLSGPLRTLTGSVKNMLVDNMSALGLDRENTATAMNAVIAGVPIAMKANTANMNGMAGLVNSITRDPDTMKVVDMVGETAVLSTVTQYAVENGMPEMLDVAVKASSSSAVANSVLKNTTGSAVSNGDLRSLQKITKALGGTQVRADHPQAAQQVMTNYKIPAGTDAAKLKDEEKLMTDTMNGLNPNWYKLNTGGQPTTNLSVFASASPDARKVLATNPEYQTPLLVAPTYQPTTTTGLLGSTFPLALSL